MMTTPIEAVFDNGVLRPLTPLPLADQQKVLVAIVGEADGPDAAGFVLPPARWDAFQAALDAPPRAIPAVRKLLTEPSVFDGPAAAR